MALGGCHPSGGRELLLEHRDGCANGHYPFYFLVVDVEAEGILQLQYDVDQAGTVDAHVADESGVVSRVVPRLLVFGVLGDGRQYFFAYVVGGPFVHCACSFYLASVFATDDLPRWKPSWTRAVV